jgi:hypothetical protein
VEIVSLTSMPKRTSQNFSAMPITEPAYISEERAALQYNGKGQLFAITISERGTVAKDINVAVVALDNAATARVVSKVQIRVDANGELVGWLV